MNSDLEHCQVVLTNNSKSFALASRLLPAPTRQAVTSLYAWCRRADDAIDEGDWDSAEPRVVLERLRQELGALYADPGGLRCDSPARASEVEADPVLRAFESTVRAYCIPRAYPESLLRGMEMDVQPLVYGELRELLTYCFRVAGTVGLMLCHVLGVRAHTALGHAAALGIAMQLTNICRDVREDWQRGRLYLPASLLPSGFQGPAAAGEDLDPSRAEQLRPAIRHLLELAEQYYASADRGLTYLRPRAAFAVHSARLIYSAIGQRLAAQGYDAMAPRAFVGRAGKLWYCVYAGWQTVIRFRQARFEAISLSDSVQHVAGVFPL